LRQINEYRGQAGRQLGARWFAKSILIAISSLSRFGRTTKPVRLLIAGRTFRLASPKYRMNRTGREVARLSKRASSTERISYE